MSDDRWVLNGDNRANYVIIPKESVFPEYRLKVDKSVTNGSERAVYLVLGTTTAHLSADDAEAMATVLMYLADQWRKENPDATT